MKKFLAIVMCLALTVSVSSCKKTVTEMYGLTSGSIETEGDFHEVNGDNLIGFQGYYSSSNYITFVFKASSPLTGRDFERLVERSEDGSMFVGSNFDGIVYSEDSSHKYATFWYEGNGNKNFISRGYFEIPTSDSEFETGYRIDVNGYDLHTYTCDAMVSFHQQTEELPNEGYTNYKYDETIEYYDEASGTWTTEEYRDLLVNNMPLE